MIASAVETRNTGFLLLARRRNTELRLPAISREGSSPSNGNVFNLGNTRTSSDGSSAWTMPPSRSALLSSSARNTNPWRSDFFHCLRRYSANMPRGEDVEIAKPVDFLLFLVADFLVVLPAPTFFLFFTRFPPHSRYQVTRIAGKISSNSLGGPCAPLGREQGTHHWRLGALDPHRANACVPASAWCRLMARRRVARSMPGSDRPPDTAAAASVPV